MSTKPEISDAAVKAAWIGGGYSCRSYRDHEQKQRDVAHVNILLEAAYPIIAADVRRQFRDELVAKARNDHYKPIIVMRADYTGDLAGFEEIFDGEMAADWLREQEAT